MATDVLKLGQLKNVFVDKVIVISDFNVRFSFEDAKSFYDCEVQHIFSHKYDDYIYIKVKRY